jgi:spatacsin
MLVLLFMNVAVVEILIRAHDCYTAALNMEGIAAVLHQAHMLTADLLQRQEWALMVRTSTFITFNWTAV